MPLNDALVDVVQSEMKLWQSEQLVECLRNPATGKPAGNPSKQAGAVAVSRYWREGLGDTQRNGCSEVAWSAAFICWSLRQVGIRLDQFPFNAGHHTYIRWAINNTKQNKIAKLYYGMRIDEYQPRPGDMIAQWRKARKDDPDPQISFDLQPDDFYAAHCDLVTKVSPTTIVAVGGNVSDRVKSSSFGAEDGLLKPKKTLICILRLAIEPEA